MPLPALLAVTALAGAAALSGHAQAGSRARMTVDQAAAHKARLVELLRARRWRDALELSKADGRGGLDLMEADLSGVNLFAVNLANANLKGSVLTGADLSSADLSGADLSNADLYNADLAYANLTGATLEGARLPEGFLTPGTRLDVVPWRGVPYGWRVVASLRGARFHLVAQA